MAKSTKNLQQFVQRKGKYQKMVQYNLVPASSSSKFIVPCLERCFGFKSNQYAKNSEKLEEFIDGASFQNFVKKANKIVDMELIRKSKNQTSAFFCMTSLFLKLSIALCILTFTILGCIIYIDFQAQKEQIILKVSVILINISYGVAAICPIYLYLRKYEEYNCEEAIFEQLKQLATEENIKNKQLGNEHLKWKFQKSFFWIELSINEEAMAKRQKKFVYRFSQHDTTPPLIQ